MAGVAKVEARKTDVKTDEHAAGKRGESLETRTRAALDPRATSEAARRIFMQDATIAKTPAFRAIKDVPAAGHALSEVGLLKPSARPSAAADEGPSIQRPKTLSGLEEFVSAQLALIVKSNGVMPPTLVRELAQALYRPTPSYPAEKILGALSKLHELGYVIVPRGMMSSPEKTNAESEWGVMTIARYNSLYGAYSGFNLTGYVSEGVSWEMQSALDALEVDLGYRYRGGQWEKDPTHDPLSYDFSRLPIPERLPQWATQLAADLTGFSEGKETSAAFTKATASLGLIERVEFLSRAEGALWDAAWTLPRDQGTALFQAGNKTTAAFAKSPVLRDGLNEKLREDPSLIIRLANAGGDLTTSLVQSFLEREGSLDQLLELRRSAGNEAGAANRALESQVMSGKIDAKGLERIKEEMQAEIARTGKTSFSLATQVLSGQKRYTPGLDITFSRRPELDKLVPLLILAADVKMPTPREVPAYFSGGYDDVLLAIENIGSPEALAYVERKTKEYKKANYHY